MAGKLHHTVVLAGAMVLLSSAAAQATLFKGDLFFTRFAGAPNVSSVPFSYDDATQTFSLGLEAPVAQAPGADGIIFAPNGNLLIGGQAPSVHEVDPDLGVVVDSSPIPGSGSFHLALDPSGTKVWTSDFGGDLVEVSLPIDGTLGTLHDVTGDDQGVTQIAFSPSGTVFYVNGAPNGGGNLGIIDMTTFVTDQIHAAVQPAHGLIYDPFTDLMTFFGDGHVGTMSAIDGSGLLTGSIEALTGVCDFDQGAVDGKGHALIAGCNGITFLDYSLSLDITNPDFAATIFGFINIDDVAPLVGLGAPPTGDAPEPATLGLVGLGLLGLAAARRKRN